MNRRIRYGVIAAGIGFSSIFSSVGLGVIFGFATVTTLACQRSEPQQGQCELKTLRGPFSWEERKTFPLKSIQSLEIVSERQIDSTDRTYYLMLETTEGSFSLHSSSYPAPLRPAVAKMGMFLENKEQATVDIKFPDARWMLYLIGGIFLTFPTAVAAALVYLFLKSNALPAADSAAPAPDDIVFSHDNSVFDEAFFDDKNFTFSELSPVLVLDREAESIE